MSGITRRQLVQAALAALSAGAFARSASSAQAEPIHHGVIGLGGQGRAHCEVFSGLDGCRVVAVCDVDPERRDAAVQALAERGKPQEYEDFRDLLAEGSIDTVSIATCDHWHVPIALGALRAGKHVYVEKPCSHNLREGHLLEEAAKHTGLCVQHGTQSRCGEGVRRAVAYLREGGIGEVRMAKAINHQFRAPIGRAPVEEPPPGVNYDLWLGPAPLVAFTRNRWHYNWHWFWDYGTGDIGNDGIHQLDIARWGLGVDYPERVVAAGGQLFYQDDHETPDTQVVTYDYGGSYLLYEMRLWTNYPLEGHENGVVFYGDEGRLDIGRQGCVVTRPSGETEQLGGGADLRANAADFIGCVRQGDASRLSAPISEGVVFAALAHLGNIATRLGRPLEYDPTRLVCRGDDEASALVSRDYRAGSELPTVP